jgi:hypothetical protein
MRSHRAVYASGFGLLLQAGIANERGRKAAAIRYLDAALRAFDAAEMKLFREVARYCRGELRRRDGAAEDTRRAEAWMTAEGVVKPRQLVATLAPGLLESSG